MPASPDSQRTAPERHAGQGWKTVEDRLHASQAGRLAGGIACVPGTG